MKFVAFSYFMLFASATNCGCKEGDVKCISECSKLPNPSNDMAEKTNDCNTQCTLSGGGDACFSSCVSQNYLANQPNAATPITTSSSETTSETSTSEATPKETETDKTKDASKTTDADKPKPTEVDKDKSKSTDDKSAPKKPNSTSKDAPSKSVPSSVTDADSHAALPAIASVMAMLLPIIHCLI